jgi:hypothetical protein
MDRIVLCALGVLLSFKGAKGTGNPLGLQGQLCKLFG